MTNLPLYTFWKSFQDRIASDLSPLVISWRKSWLCCKPSHKSRPSWCSSLTTNRKGAPQQRKKKKHAAGPYSGTNQPTQGGWSTSPVYHHWREGVKLKYFSSLQHRKRKRLTHVLCLWGIYGGSCVHAELGGPLFRNTLELWKLKKCIVLHREWEHSWLATQAWHAPVYRNDAKHISSDPSLKSKSVFSLVFAGQWYHNFLSLSTSKFPRSSL